MCSIKYFAYPLVESAPLVTPRIIETAFYIDETTQRAEFDSLYTDAPLFTIHDGVFTTEEFVRKLNGFILKRLNELTGILAGCKVKSSQIDPKPQIQDVENQWAKIEHINTEEKYLKNINGVFTSNIIRGSRFLENFGRNFLKGIDDQI